MANGKFLPLGERKYLSMKEMAGHLGLGFTKVDWRKRSHLKLHKK